MFAGSPMAIAGREPGKRSQQALRGTTVTPLSTPSPIRGREREVSVLEAQLAVLSEGHGSITVLEGSPGAGKTRLVAEATNIAGRLGVRVGAGGARRGDRVVTMGALLDALAGGSEPLFAREAFRDVESVPDLRYWLAPEIEAMLERAASAESILVSIDDLQWADGGTIGAFEGLALRLAGLPIAWLVAWRPAEIPPEVGEALGRLEAAGALRLSLAPLDDDAVAQVVGDLAGAEPDDSLLHLAASADGIPFWITELLTGLREEGLLETRDGRAGTATMHLPARMSDTIHQRLERMSPLARQVGSVGAALGRRFPFNVMAAMVGAYVASLLEPVDELIRADILVDQGDHLSFRHDIVREAVLDSMPAPARTALEREAVSALLAAGLPPTEVAEQLAASAQPGDSEAIDVLFAAAKSLGTSDPAAAADLAMRALELTPRDDPRRGPLVAEVAILLHAAGRLDEATSFAQTALTPLLPPAQESKVLFSIAGMFSLSADMRADAGRRALALPGLSRQDRARHQARLVHNVLAGGRRTEAQRLLADVSEEIAGIGDEATVFSLGLATGGLCYEEGRLVEWLEKMGQAAARDQLRARTHALASQCNGAPRSLRPSTGSMRRCHWPSRVSSRRERSLRHGRSTCGSSGADASITSSANTRMRSLPLRESFAQRTRTQPSGPTMPRRSARSLPQRSGSATDSSCADAASSQR